MNATKLAAADALRAIDLQFMFYWQGRRLDSKFAIAMRDCQRITAAYCPIGASE